MREAFRLIDKTIALAALPAVSGCGFALLFREPATRILFERGSFTAESTALVSAVFLGLGPALFGWSVIEIQSRSLFALDRPWVPVMAAAIPVFAVLFLPARTMRRSWVQAVPGRIARRDDVERRVRFLPGYFPAQEAVLRPCC